MKTLCNLILVCAIMAGCCACNNSKDTNTSSPAVVTALNDSTEITLHQAFEAVNDLPCIDGVTASDSLDRSAMLFEHLIHNAKKTGRQRETYTSTGTYGNAIYAIMGRLPARELIKGHLDDQTIFVIYAHPMAENKNEVLIIFDSARIGCTSAIIGESNNAELEYLRKCTLSCDEQGRVSVLVPAYIAC